MGSNDQLVVQDRTSPANAPVETPADTAAPGFVPGPVPGPAAGPAPGPAPDEAATPTPPEKHDGTPLWQRRIWIGCSVGLMLVIATLCLISAFALGKTMLLLEVEDRDHLFQFAGMNLITGSLLRLLAILIGGTIAFVGLAVSFFAHQRATSLNLSHAREKELTTTAALVTYSPGIVAIVIGAAVIISAIYARGTYNYQPAAVSNQAGRTDPVPYDLPSLDDVLKTPEKQDEHQEAPPALDG